MQLRLAWWRQPEEQVDSNVSICAAAVDVAVLLLAADTYLGQPRWWWRSW